MCVCVCGLAVSLIFGARFHFSHYQDESQEILEVLLEELVLVRDPPTTLYCLLVCYLPHYPSWLLGINIFW